MLLAITIRHAFSRAAEAKASWLVATKDALDVLNGVLLKFVRVFQSLEDAFLGLL